LLAIGATVAVLVVLVILYLADFLTVAPAAVPAVVRGGVTSLTLQTVPSYGHAPDPDWVTYLVQDSGGHWHHSTVFQLPAHTLVHVTLYQYDTATGLRNPFLAQVRGTQGGTATLNGKSFSTLNADDASHTFTIPDIGLSVPLSGISDTAKNPCSVAPCGLGYDHNTITFTFMTPGRGTYRWQCFVPCGAQFIFGNGGPMQTIGWMDGWLKIV
jgi:hypothetical protein